MLLQHRVYTSSMLAVATHATAAGARYFRQQIPRALSGSVMLWRLPLNLVVTILKYVYVVYELKGSPLPARITQPPAFSCSIIIFTSHTHTHTHSYTPRKEGPVQSRSMIQGNLEQDPNTWETGSTIYAYSWRSSQGFMYLSPRAIARGQRQFSLYLVNSMPHVS